MDRVRLVGIVFVLLSAISYGSGGLFAQPVYAAGVDWLTLMAWRFGIAGALAWGMVFLQPGARRALRTVKRRTVLISLGLGLLFIGNTATYYAAIVTVPLSLAALIVYIYPPVVAVLALRLGRPLEGRRAWTALGLAVLGVVLAVGGIDTSTAPPLQGLVLIIIAPLWYSGWIILAARHSGERSGSTGAEAEDAADASVTGAIILTGAAIGYWTWCLVTAHPALPSEIPAAAWPGILGVAVVAGFIAVQGFYAGAQRIGAAQASLVSTVEPLWTIVAAGLLLGERLEPVQWLGGALILVGVLLAQTRGRRSATGDAGPPLPQPIVYLGEE